MLLPWVQPGSVSRSAASELTASHWASKTWDALLVPEDYAAATADGRWDRDVHGFLRTTPGPSRRSMARTSSRIWTSAHRRHRRTTSLASMPVAFVMSVRSAPARRAVWIVEGCQRVHQDAIAAGIASSTAALPAARSSRPATRPRSSSNRSPSCSATEQDVSRIALHPRTGRKSSPPRCVRLPAEMALRPVVWQQERGRSTGALLSVGDGRVDLFA